ncbi:hypothetical protein [Nocardioides sp. 1609]|uniref:hypothetical protein n=1 Tax=Nocardioides sp. 1609 TaxID=2508327 RepID=UPI00107006C2|nr:hypothetical protein [Nocardioides sp. 1609]
MNPTPPRNPPLRPVIRSQADLERVWRDLMEPLGFSGHSTWMMLVDADDRPLPRLTQVEDCDRVPEPEMLTGFAELAGHLLEEVAPGGRCALLRSRPGAGVTDVDRAWARGLVEACRELGVATDVVHLATDVDLVPLPLDALAA